LPQSDFWDRLKKRLVEVSNAAADFTEEQAIIGKLKFDILTLRRKIDRSLHDIGSRVLEMSRLSKSDNPLHDREVKESLDLISDLETQVERKRKDINDVTDQFRRRRVAREKLKNEDATPSEPPPRPAPAKPAAKKATPKRAPIKAPAEKPVEADPVAKKRPGRPKKKVEPEA